MVTYVLLYQKYAINDIISNITLYNITIFATCGRVFFTFFEWGKSGRFITNNQSQTGGRARLNNLLYFYLISYRLQIT